MERQNESNVEILVLLEALIMFLSSLDSNLDLILVSISVAAFLVKVNNRTSDVLISGRDIRLM